MSASPLDVRTSNSSSSVFEVHLDGSSISSFIDCDQSAHVRLDLLYRHVTIVFHTDQPIPTELLPMDRFAQITVAHRKYYTVSVIENSFSRSMGVQCGQWGRACDDARRGEANKILLFLFV